MAVTRALAATGEKIEDSERTVTSALAANVRAFLPAIADGTGATVAAGYTVEVAANAAGYIEVLSATGYRVAMVRKGDIMVIEAFGNATDNRWVVTRGAAILSAGVLASNGTLLPAMGGELIATLANDPADIVAAAELTTSITVTGAALGDMVIAGYDKDLAGLTITAYVSAANTVKVKLDNLTGSAIDLASGNFFVKVFKSTGNLPAAATEAVASWARIQLADGSFGLIPVFAE